MKYLEERGIVHRDLAARNVLGKWHLAFKFVVNIYKFPIMLLIFY